jgi:hypothetical protein
VIRLLQEPALIQQELDRRLVAARASDPTRKREQSLQRELTHVGKALERVLNAYQEGLLSIEQLRERMPMLRQREQRLRHELQAIADQTKIRTAYLRLAETLTAFLTRLRSAAQTLSVIERQKIVRLLVKDILVGKDTITIRHSIPIPSGLPMSGRPEISDGRNYLLCKGRDHSALGQTLHESPFLGEDGPPALSANATYSTPPLSRMPNTVNPLVTVPSVKKPMGSKWPPKTSTLLFAVSAANSRFSRGLLVIASAV